MYDCLVVCNEMYVSVWVFSVCYVLKIIIISFKLSKLKYSYRRYSYSNSYSIKYE